MIKINPEIQKSSQRAFNEEYPEYDTTFYEMAWNDFNFDMVLKVLLDRQSSFPSHKKTLLSALGAWVVAPDRPEVRQSAIISVVRLTLTEVEEEVLRAPEKERFGKDLAWRLAGMGPRFMQEIYYPIGGIKVLVQELTSSHGSSHLSNQFNSQIRSFEKVFQIIHHESQIERDMREFHTVSLKRTYQSIFAINKYMRRSKIFDENTKYLAEKSYQALIGKRGSNLILTYAASLVMISNDNTLLDRFLDPDIRCSATEQRQAIERWLGVSAFLFKDVIPKLGSAKLLPDDRYAALRVEPIEVPCSSLESWEDEIITEKMKKSHRSQPKYK